MMAIASIVAEFENVIRPYLTCEIKVYKLAVINTHNSGCMREYLVPPTSDIVIVQAWSAFTWKNRAQ